MSSTNMGHFAQGEMSLEIYVFRLTYPGEMSFEISATYLGRWGNKHWKSRRIYVALGHDELMKERNGWPTASIVYYSDVIMSAMASKLTASRLFPQPFV